MKIDKQLEAELNRIDECCDDVKNYITDALDEDNEDRSTTLDELQVELKSLGTKCLELQKKIYNMI